VGFNPYRPHRTSKTDYVFVAAGLVITVVLLLWAVGAF
jgi:hypothetical protein